MSPESNIFQEYTKASAAKETFRNRWDDFLELAYARIPEAKGFKSRISTGDLSNLVIERNARVAAQVPTGKIVPLSTDFDKKSTIINLAWSEYVIPNANWQYSFPVKLRMWDFYSLTYGIMPMFHGYDFSENYTGPNCRLVDLRFISPQEGRLSPNDADYVFYETFHSKSDLEGMVNKDGWNSENLRNLLDGKAENNSQNQATPLQNSRGEGASLNDGMYRLITKYIKGYESVWTTIDESGNVLRTVSNPFKSGRIPIVFKLAFPLVDSFWGLGDVERGESLQKAINSITNLSIDYLKTLIFPPLVMKKGMNISQYPFKPAARWLVDNQEDIKAATLNQAPAQIVSQLNQNFKGALMNQNGTTDTTISASDGLPGFGKTPDALDKLDKRESSRDNFDRQMFEAACKELFEGMLEEFATRHDLPVVFDVFEKQITELESTEAGTALLGEKYDKNYAEITIQPDDFHGKYKFNLDVGSSAENDEKQEFERIKAVIDMLETPFGEKAIQQLEATGKTFDYSELLNQFLNSANVKNKDKMIIAKQEPKISDENTTNDDISEDYNPNMITDPNLQKIVTEGGY